MLMRNVIMQALTPRTSRSTKEELAAFTDPDNSKARLGATVSRPGENAASAMKRAFSTASVLSNLPRHASGPFPQLLDPTPLHSCLALHACQKQYYS